MKPSKEPLRPGARFLLFVGWQKLADLFGKSVEDLLRESDLPLEWADEEHARLTTEEVLRFWDTLERWAEGPAVIKVLLSSLNELLPAPYLAALSCPDLRAAYQRYAECKPFLGPIRFRLQREQEGTSFFFDWAVPLERISAVLVLMEFALVLALAERGTGRVIRPLRAESPMAPSIEEAVAREMLGIPVEKSPAMRLVFTDSDLDTPLQTANPITRRILDEHFAHIASSSSGNWSREVRLALQRLLPAEGHSMENVAAELGLSTRRLQRELATEGTSFKTLLNEIRRELSLHYLGAARYNAKETAFLLGYSEPATFYRAFRSWTGDSPMTYLRRIST